MVTGRVKRKAGFLVAVALLVHAVCGMAQPLERRVALDLAGASLEDAAKALAAQAGAKVVSAISGRAGPPMSVSLRNVSLQEGAGAISHHWGISWRFFDDVIAFGPLSAAAYPAEALSSSDYWWGFPRGGEQVALLWFDRGDSAAEPIVQFLDMLPDKAQADLADGLPVSLDSLPDAARAALQAVASALPGIDLTTEPAPTVEMRRVSWFGAEEFARNLAPYAGQVPHISQAQIRVAGGVYLLKDLIGMLGASAGASIEARPDIADTRLFLSEGNYNSNALLGALCFASGARVSQTSPSIWLAPLANRPVMLAGPRKDEGEPLNVAVLGEPKRLARILGEGRDAGGMFQGAVIVFKRGGEVLLRVVALARTRPILRALQSPARTLGTPNCGLLALFALGKVMGKAPTTEQQNDLIARYPGEEMSMQDIVEAGKAIGVSLAPYEISLADIQSRGRPAIIHSQGGHFTLLVAISDKQATVVDCSVNELAIPLDGLRDTYSGKALLPE